MHNPRLANRYAKSILDLAIEKGQVDAVYKDMKLIIGVCKSNPDFVAVLRSPIIKADKKGKIIAAIVQNSVSELTNAFVNLLVNKGRETNLDEIAHAFVEQYNKKNGIHQLKITTATVISDEIRDDIAARVKASAGYEHIEVETVVNDALIGGYILETGGKLIDASILRDLKEVREQFLNNDYIHKIR
jgi:F-type H+-transporting ATPase subunit delta